MSLPDLATMDEMLRASPFHRLLDVHLVEAERGRVRVRIHPRDDLVGNTLNNSIHGGVLSGLVDLAAGVAVMVELGYPCPTVDLRVDFLRPAFPGKHLDAVAKVVRAGQSVAFAEASISDADGREVCRGSAVYSTTAFRAARE